MRPLIYILFLFMTSCTSMLLPSTELKHASGVRYDEPKTPFTSMSVKSADKAWISTATNNTISYLSDCNSQSDSSLKQIQAESLAFIDKLKLLEEKDIEYNGREALYTNANGEVDGIAVQIKLLIFKKNSCTYTLTYSGTKKKFSKEEKIFDQFKESFKAP